MASEDDDGWYRKRVAIIGGGLSGLSAAYRLIKDGGDKILAVDLYEASGRLGGVVKTGKSGGWVYDLGPNSAAAKHPEVEEMLRDLTSNRPEGSVGSRVFRQARSKAVLIWKGGKWRILGDLFVRKRRATRGDHGDESLDSFFSRRFGRELTDYLINPMVAGVYSGKTTALSVAHTFPVVYRAEAQGVGSVILGMMLGRSKDRNAPPKRKIAGVTPSDLKLSFNFRGGMETLMGCFSERLGVAGSPFKLHLKTPVRKLCYNPNRRAGWLVNDRHYYDAVISATPAHALGKISVCEDIQNSFLAYGLLALSSSITYAPMAVVALGYRARDLVHNLDAFGILTPEKEGRKILGTTFASSLYSGRVPGAAGENALVNVYLGGSREPTMMGLKDRALAETAHTEMKSLIGARSKPVFSKVYKWDKGIPQATLGYGKVIATVKEVEKVYPGFHFAGNWRGLGIGVPDAMRSGLLAAERVMAKQRRKNRN